MVEYTNQILATLTIAGQFALVALGLLIYGRAQVTLRPWFELLVKHAALWAWLVALVATTGSLWYSEVIGYEPCKLCWWQRIFMYPLAVILALSWQRRERVALFYAGWLALLGGVVALYHYTMQRGLLPSAVCSITGAADCSREYVFAFDYVTIPMMSLTAFALIGVLVWAGWKLGK